MRSRGGVLGLLITLVIALGGSVLLGRKPEARTSEAPAPAAAPPCKPLCAGRTCGPDGCGGRCAPDSCGAARSCDARGACGDNRFEVLVDPGAAEAGLGAAVGLPFARGALADPASLRLESSGKEVPAQFRTLATWSDGSARAVLASFLPAKGASYQARHGVGTRHTALPAAPVSVKADGEALVVSTGGLSVRVRKTGFAIEQVTLDGAPLLSAASAMSVTDALAAGARGTPTGVTWTVEDEGPVVVTLRATGAIAPIAFEARLAVWSGGTATLDVTLIDPRPERDAGASRSRLALSLSSWKLTLPLAKASAWRSEGGPGKALSGSGATSLRQQNTINYNDGELEDTTFSFTGAATGTKAQGWFDAGGVLVALRDFWRAAPSGFALGMDGTLDVELFPLVATPSTAYPALTGKRYTRPNSLYSPHEGAAKTRTVLLRFHSPATPASGAAALNAAFQAHQPRAWVTPARYAATAALVELREAGPWSSRYDAGLLSGVVERSYDEIRDRGGLALVYSWRDFGDRMRPGWAEVSPGGVRIPGFYNDTHVGARQWFHQWARTLDRRWYEMADIGTSWFRDLGVSHTGRAGRWPHNYGPGEGMLVKHEIIDHACDNLHPGHAHASGLADRYLLTGDRRDLEVLREIGDWWTAAQPDFFPLPVPHPHEYAEAERDYGWPLYTILEAYRGTGDPRYLAAATRMVRHLIGWWQQPADHLQAGKVVGKNDAGKGTGYFTMTRADNCGDGWSGSNPWMAGSVLNALILYRDAALESGRSDIADPEVVRTMILQVMTYVTRWGYLGKPGAGGFFRYAECVDYDGGDTHLLTPVAWSVRELRRGVANAAWYDKAALWEQILDAAATHGITPEGNTALGFYGYEETFAPSYFTIMKDLGKLP